MKLADFRENLSNEIKLKLNDIFDENSNDWMNRSNYLQQMNQAEFNDLKEFNERINICEYSQIYF